MSKKLLRTITEQQERLIGQFNKNNKVQAKHGGMGVGRFKTEEQEAYEKAVKDGDTKKAIELIDMVRTTPNELYFNMPDLKVSDNGSIQSLRVFVYSVEVNNEVLLHKIFSKIREQA